MTDARYFQITFLAALLTLGSLSFGFEIPAIQIAIVLSSVLLTQCLAIYLFRLPWHGLLSAGISGLGLLLLGRSNSLPILAATGVLSIASKFILKWNGKHFFNPTNFGIVAVLLVTGEIWISPGQWGASVLVASWIFLLGTIVVLRAHRWDVSFLFLLFFVSRKLCVGEHGRDIGSSKAGDRSSDPFGLAIVSQVFAPFPNQDCRLDRWLIGEL